MKARMPQARRLHLLLRLPLRLPPNFQTSLERDIAGAGESPRILQFNVLTAIDADARSQEVVGNQAPGRGRPRIFAQCDACQMWVSCGRFNQHYKIHEEGR